MQKIEKVIIREVLAALDTAGFKPCKFTDPDTGKIVLCNTPDAVVNAVSEYEDLFLQFEGGSAWIRFIAGNGVDIISDFSTTPVFAQTIAEYCDTIGF